MGLQDRDLAALEEAYRGQERLLLDTGEGALFPGVERVLAAYRRDGLLLALGAEATRDYLMQVSDQHNMDGTFAFALCTDEFGGGGADEMIDEIMCLAQVHASETLALGTRPAFFRAARGQDVVTLGCGWGLIRHEALAQADLQCLTPDEMNGTILSVDRRLARERAWRESENP
jgi:adenosylhomocysteine nucleosidase